MLCSHQFDEVEWTTANVVLMFSSPTLEFHATAPAQIKPCWCKSYPLFCGIRINPANHWVNDSKLIYTNTGWARWRRSGKDGSDMNSDQVNEQDSWSTVNSVCYSKTLLSTVTRACFEVKGLLYYLARKNYNLYVAINLVSISLLQLEALLVEANKS